MLISRTKAKRIWALVVFFIVSVKLSAQTATDGEKLSIVTENWFPFNHLTEKGEIKGTATEYVELLLKEAEVEYSIELLPWARAMSLAETKENTAIYTILKTPERASLFHWICPIVQKQTHQIYKLTARKDIDIRTEDELKNYSIAVVRETFLQGYMLENGLVENINLLLTADDIINTTLFLAGRVDLLAEFAGNIEKTLLDAGLDKNAVQAVFTVPAERYPDYCLAISKQTPDSIIKKIRNAQQRLL